MRVLRLCSVLVFVATQAWGASPEFAREKRRISYSPNSAFSFDLHRLLKDPQVASTWTSSKLQAWMKLDRATGVLSGKTPTSIGEFPIRLRATAGGVSAECDLYLTVDRPAAWKDARINLGKIPTGQAFEYDLRSQIEDPDQVYPWVTASKLPAWMTLDKATGKLSGNPDSKDRGKFDNLEFQIGTNKTTIAFGEVLLKMTPREEGAPSTKPAAPRPRAVAAAGLSVTNDPLKFSTLVARKPFSYDLSTNVVYSGTGKLTYVYRKFPPNWLGLDANTGRLSGTPTQQESFTAVVEISDGTTNVQNVLQFDVGGSNQAPIVNGAALVFNVKERETKVIDLSDPVYASDDVGPLTFRFSKPSQWANLSQAGKLTLAPRFAQLGPQTLSIEVSDGVLATPADIRVTVAPDPQTPVWDPPTKIQAKVGADLSVDLTLFTKDPDGRKLRFSRISGPTWLGVTDQGQLYGTVAEPTGDRPFAIRAFNEAKSADQTLMLTVTRDNRAPAWKVQSITLKNARAGEPYSATVNDPMYVSDPDGDPIVFSWVAGLRWPGVAENGTIAGTPRTSHVGVGSLRVKATDSKGASSEISVNLTVDPPNASPAWTVEQPIALGQVQVGKGFSLDLSGHVKDPEGDPLTFRKASGPTWLTVDAKGLVGGTPPVGEKFGNFTAIVEVSDGRTPVQAAFVGAVVPPNNLPKVNLAALKFTMDERRTLPVDLLDFVSDPDAGDKLVFSMPALRQGWVDLTPAGLLTLRPGFAQVGVVAVKFKVSDGKDTVDGVVTVTVNRSPRPPRWTQDEIKLTATAGVPFSRPLKMYAEDLDGIPITFALKKALNGNWLTIDPDGTAHGTPQDEDAGESAFIVLAQNDKLAADAVLVINVTSDNSRPVWNKNPVVLDKARSGVTYFKSVKAFAVDPDIDDTLRFTVAVDTRGARLAPAWAEVTTSGLVFGTPEESDVGVNQLTLRVTDSRKAWSEARVQVEVVSKNNAPRWLTRPLQLGNVKVGDALSFDLSRIAVDDDGDALQFRKKDGPAWLMVGVDGNVGGRPKETDVGDYVAEFEVTDGKAFVSVEASGKVGGSVKPPIIKSQSLKFTAVPGVTSEIDLKVYVEDPENGTLKFSLTGALPWTSVTEEGLLKLSPPPGQKNDHSVGLKVASSSGAWATAVIQISLDSAIQEPKWLQDLEFNATVDVTFTGNLADFARDVNARKLPLSFSKVSGADWLVVNPNGLMTGRPTAALRGDQKFRVSASNGFKAAEMDMVIHVAGGRVTDTYSFSDPEPGASVDLLFVLDYSTATSDYYRRMQDESAEFFQKLDRAKVNYSAGVLSSRNFLGALTPAGGTRSVVISGRSSYAAQDFRSMISGAGSAGSYNSPVWALDRFFVNLGDTRAYGGDFYQSETPLLVYIATSSMDKFQTLQRGMSNANMDGVVRGFLGFHAKKHKPFQVYIYDMSCDGMAGKDYNTLAYGTNGTVMISNPCAPPFPVWLTGYADTVIEQSARFKKKYFELSRKPVDPSTLKVTMRFFKTDYVLNGNTGQESDQWHYDATQNTVVLHWWNIRMSYNPTTDRLFIDY